MIQSRQKPLMDGRQTKVSVRSMTLLKKKKLSFAWKTTKYKFRTNKQLLFPTLFPTKIALFPTFLLALVGNTGDFESRQLSKVSICSRLSRHHTR